MYLGYNVVLVDGEGFNNVVDRYDIIDVVYHATYVQLDPSGQGRWLKTIRKVRVADKSSRISGRTRIFEPLMQMLTSQQVKAEVQRLERDAYAFHDGINFGGPNGELHVQTFDLPGYAIREHPDYKPTLAGYTQLEYYLQEKYA